MNLTIKPLTSALADDYFDFFENRAFTDGISIGWCNANDKANYPAEPYYTDARLFHAPLEKREKAVICFEIAPAFRGKGVATALLQHVVDDAKAEGYIAVEGFPVVRDERYEWDNPGPIRLYEKIGFVEVARQGDRVIMRKTL
jgi:GNAT superfamily N-acetyltransferase